MESLPAPVRKFGPFVGVVLVLVVGYLGYGKLSGGASTEAEAEAGTAPTPLDLESAADDKKDRREERVAGPLVSLGEPLVVNLGDAGGRTTVRVGVTLQVDEGTPVAPAAEGESAPQLVEQAIARDVVIATLGGLTSANLLQPAAREAVRDLLVRRLNRGVPATLVLRAYFTELTVEDANAGAAPVDLDAVVAAAAKAEEAADEAKANAEQAAADAEDAAQAEADASGEEATSDEADAGEHATTVEKDTAGKDTASSSADDAHEDEAASAKEDR